MSFGNVPRDCSFSSIAALRSTASKSINGFFSANIRTVGALVQYERSPDIWVTAEADTVPATQLGNLYTLPGQIQRTQVKLNFDGTVMAVGLIAPVAGSVLSILTNTAGFYSQQVIPLPPDAVGVTNGSAYLSDNGKILAFGSGTDNGGIGAVWIYADVAGVWTLQGTKITGPGEIGNGQFGQQVSLSGDGTLLAVGSPQETPYGAAYIFNLTSLSSPTFVARLLGSSVDAGGVFGWDVAFSADGSTLAVGASSNLGFAGSVFVFTKVQGVWLQQAFLTAPSGFPTQFLGYSVSMSADGNTLAASSLTNAVIYYRSGANWSAGSALQLPYDLVGVSTQYYASLSHDGNILCTSSQNNNNNVGASWIFIQGPLGTWTQDGPALIGTGAPAAPPTQQSYTVISGDGKTAATQSNIATGYVWVFV